MRSRLAVRNVRPIRAAIAAAVLVVPGPAAALAAGQIGPQAARSGGAPQLAATPPRALASAARFVVKASEIDALGDRPVHVRGRLLPALAGRTVTLMGRRAGRWRKLASARTRAHGGFDLRFSADAASGRRLRVSFAGDRFNASASAYAGRVTVFHPSGASWYDDAGGTACGFHAHFGVANRTLPCGTRVSFYYAGRTVTAVVDDRGPFVAGRDWDLNQNTASALGFGGVDTVWTSP